MKCNLCQYFQTSKYQTKWPDTPDGTCRIRSYNGPFPSRFGEDWCGEFIQKDSNPKVDTST